MLEKNSREYQEWILAKVVNPIMSNARLTMDNILEWVFHNGWPELDGLCFWEWAIIYLIEGLSEDKFVIERWPFPQDELDPYFDICGYNMHFYVDE